MFSKLRISILSVFSVLILLNPSTALAERKLDVPQVLGEQFNSQSIANFIGERQLVLMHDATKIKTRYDQEKARFVTTMVVIDSPLETVKETITDYENYDKIHPSMSKISVTSSSSDTSTVKFNYELDLNLISPQLTYTLEYFPGEGNDILWHLVSGDLNASRGRWEFQRLSDSKTLLSYTGWADFSGLGLAIDTIFWAQPELELVMPVSGSAVLVRNFKEYITPKITDFDTNSLPTSPDVPLFSENSVPNQLIKLSKKGTPLIIHRDRFIRDVSGEPLRLRFVSGMGVLEAPSSRAKKLMTQYDKVKNFVSPVSSVEAKQTDTGLIANWNASFGLGPLSVGFEYKLDYDWETNQALVFRQLSGDLDHVYGAQEWIPYKKKKTLYFLTSTHEIGERAGLLVRLGNLIPNRQIAVGVAFAGIGVEKHINWANEQIEIDQ